MVMAKAQMQNLFNNLELQNLKCWLINSNGMHIWILTPTRNPSWYFYVKKVIAISQ
jgi:hypothetical protein